MNGDKLSRRAVLGSTAAVALSALAGCSGSGTSSSDETTEAETTEATTADAGTADGSSSGDEESFDGWFDGVTNYDGVVDETGTSEVPVAVGAEGNNGNYAYEPAAVRVDAGTTVVWEWTGKGASHNVVAEDGSFESEMTQEEGFTFEHTFEEAGTYKYVCTPHRAMGMKGVVVVE